MTSCPSCGKPVDPLRAPAVGVRDGKVVSYCSRECAALAESGPAKLVPTKIMRVPTPVPVPAEAPAKKPVTPASGVVATGDGALDSGPVIEIVREPSRPVAASNDDDAVPRPYPRVDSVQIADTGRLDDYITPEPRRRGLFIGLALLALGVGAAGGAYYLGYLGNSSAATTRTDHAPSTPADAAEVAPADAALPVIEPAQALARAQEVLHAQMQSESPRVQRLAASALSRTGDAAAIELLAAALQREKGLVAKVELAYVLARAGDQRGLDALVAAGRGEREARHSAGSQLALLGDERAIKLLVPSLQWSQFRLGVAEHLAYLAEPRALEVLEEVRANPNALPDEKARATIALGIAGRTDVVPALEEMLADDRNNAFAAVALARLGNAAARPVLLRQLTLSALRVPAARALRRLAPDADVRELLAPLVTALDAAKDIEQVHIAEAILLLAGPPAWSERA